MAKETRTPQQQRSREKYDAVLEAAARVVARDGYSEASTSKIADEAGVSVGTIYAYFEDKDDIFSTYVDTRLAEIMGAIADNVATSNYSTVEDGIRDIVRVAVQFTMDNRKTLSAMVGNIPGVYDAFMLQRMMEPLYVVSEQFYRSHGLVSTSREATRMTYVLTGAIPGFFIRLVSDEQPPMSVDEISEDVAELMLRYMVRFRDSE